MAKRKYHKDQLPLIVPDSDWRSPNLGDLPSWKGAKRIAIDLETCDPSIGAKLGMGPWRDGYAVGVSFAIEDGERDANGVQKGYYLPFRHEGGDNLDPGLVAQYLRDQARVFNGEIAGANLSYDINYLWTIGVEFKPEFYRDIQVAEPLCDELQFRYSMEAVAERRGIPGKDETLLKEACSAYGYDLKGDLWRLPARYVGAYAERDVTLPLELLQIQEKQIEKEGLREVYDLESRLLPVLARMHQRGVRIDHDQLDKVATYARKQQEQAVDEVNARTGCSLGYDDLNKSGALAKPLEGIGITVPLTPKNKQPSITKELLENIDHPVAKAILLAKQYEKLQNTFVDSIRRYVVGEYLHCTFNQLRREKDDGTVGGPRFGRISSADPNMQQQPSPDRDKKKGPFIGKMWRDIYIPEDGEQWYCLDYSQQEPRWIVHYSVGRKYLGSIHAAERYANDPTMDFHQMMADMTKLPRSEAKIVFLAICYGKGGASLCHDLNLPTRWIEIKNRGKWSPNFRPHENPDLVWCEVAGKEGEAIMKQFDREAPFVKKLTKYCEGRAQARGYIKTFSGRRCRFPMDASGNYDWTHKSINRLIQGSSADQTKAAMVALDAEGFPLRLQVHDEVDMSLATIAEAREAKLIMEEIYQLRVPSKVDLEFGPSWGSLVKEAA